MLKLFKSGIFKRQFTYFFTMIIFTFATIAGIIFVITENSQEKQQLEIVKSYRVETSQTMNRWIQGRAEYIKVQASFFQTLNKEELKGGKVKEIIRNQLSWNGNFSDIGIIDNKGNLINSKEAEQPNINFSDRRYFQIAVKGDPYIESFIRGKKDGVPILVIAYPIKLDEKTNYVLYGVITLEKVTKLVENLNLGKVGYAYLVDSDGLKITDNQYINEITEDGVVKDKTKYKIDRIASDDLMSKGSGTNTYKGSNGEKVYGSYEWLDILNVGIVIEFREKIVMKPLNDLTRTIVIVGGLIAVIGLILAFIISRKMVEPIYMLIESATQITDNNYKEHIEVKADSELGILANQFNRMQEAIENREKQLTKKNEELKIERAEAIQANELKSQFLANMSHELRTPLNSIIGFTGRVIKKSGYLLQQAQRENLEIVMEQASHLLTLINDLLDYSKIEAGKMQISNESFNLIEVISEVYNMMRGLIEDKSMLYTQELFSMEIPMYSDRMKIKQILINLMSNAIKYSQKGEIKVSVQKDQNEYVIKIKDQGIGITEEHIASIFDEFRQIDGTYTRKIGGTGLGLSITKKLVELLHGTIQVESVFEEGSLFTIRIPINYEEREEKIAKREPELKPLDNSVKKIVCIDDDLHVQRLYKEYISEQDYEIIPFTGEEDIIEEVRYIQPQVIILDIMLPHQDGWEILSQLKTDNETKTIPVIMASLLSEKNLAFRMKADEYIVKPVLQDEFIEAIKKTIMKKGNLDL